jgi:hypothetical protein
VNEEVSLTAIDEALDGLTKQVGRQKKYAERRLELELLRLRVEARLMRAEANLRDHRVEMTFEDAVEDYIKAVRDRASVWVADRVFHLEQLLGRDIGGVPGTNLSIIGPE